MRLISQDGLIDVSYENILLNLYDGDRAVAIKAYDSVSDNDFVIMGVYETVAKAEKVMKMVRDKYAEYLHTDGGTLATVNFYVQPNVWNIPKVFQFPQDDEVEV